LNVSTLNSSSSSHSKPIFRLGNIRFIIIYNQYSLLIVAVLG
jgi:hypothetical protein